MIKGAESALDLVSYSLNSGSFFATASFFIVT
jgi:hypothetical protein